jgi:hypothetical protein
MLFSTLPSARAVQRPGGTARSRRRLPGDVRRVRHDGVLGGLDDHHHLFLPAPRTHASTMPQAVHQRHATQRQGDSGGTAARTLLPRRTSPRPSWASAMRAGDRLGHGQQQPASSSLTLPSAKGSFVNPRRVSSSSGSASAAEVLRSVSAPLGVPAALPCLAACGAATVSSSPPLHVLRRNRTGGGGGTCFAPSAGVGGGVALAVDGAPTGWRALRTHALEQWRGSPQSASKGETC